MNFRESLDDYTQKVNNIIYRYLPEENNESVIREAIEYNIKAGGKRIRPVIMYSVFKLFNGDLNEEIISPFIAAIEMIHTYSLIHDDLPCMDNDELRRGKPTTHVIYGEDMAVLTGDALLNLAFETAGKAFEVIKKGDKEECVLYERTTKAIRILGQKSGIYGMLGGQVIDVQNDGKINDIDQLIKIYELKTSALLEASFDIGAVLGGADENQIKICDRIAKLTGIAFQIKDDILDVEGNQNELGKPVNSDIKNNKTTYTSLLGLQKAKEEAQRYTREALMLINELPNDKKFISDLVNYLLNRNN